MNKILKALFISIVIIIPLISHGQKITIDRNSDDRKEWFSDMGFGMFIH